MTRPNDFPFIRRWGQLMGSHDRYVTERIKLAQLEQAPQDALYRHDNGTWATTDDITSANIRRHLGLEPLTVRPPDVSVILAELRQAILLTDRFRDEFGLTEIQPSDE